MAYFEFDYHRKTFSPIAADMWGNAEGDRLRIGQIDQPDGVHFRVNLYLPEARQTWHETLQEATSAAIEEANAWIDRMGLEEAK